MPSFLFLLPLTYLFVSEVAVPLPILPSSLRCTERKGAERGVGGKIGCLLRKVL